jgi:hypothetical protein
MADYWTCIQYSEQMPNRQGIAVRRSVRAFKRTCWTAPSPADDEHGAHAGIGAHGLDGAQQPAAHLGRAGIA